MYASLGTWSSWIDLAWPKLREGTKLEAASYLPHPKTAGFSPESIATPHGQCADWVLSFNDGSRIHVHEYSDGRRLVHRDRYDPNQGLGNLIAHLTFETPLVPLVLLGFGILAEARWARS